MRPNMKFLTHNLNFGLHNMFANSEYVISFSLRFLKTLIKKVQEKT